MAEQPASIHWFFGVILPQVYFPQREEVKHFFLEDHPELKMLGSSKVTDVLCRAPVFRYV